MFVKASLLILSALFAALTSGQAIPTEKTCFECVNKYKYWNATSDSCSFTYSGSAISTANGCFQYGEISFNATTLYAAELNFS